MRWLRRRTPSFEYLCFACKARYTGPSIEAIATLGHEHPNHCPATQPNPAGIITWDGELKPEVVAALRRTIRRQGGDPGRALGSI